MEHDDQLDPDVLKIAGEILTQMAMLAQKKSDKCPTCQQLVTSLEQVGRCVYARPCGCRFWQGKVPEAWRS